MGLRGWVGALTLVTWLAPACVSEQAGHEQALMLRVEGELPAEVKSAHLVIGAAELVPCQGSYARATTTGIGSRLKGWLVPKAHAHSASNALRIGAPQVVALRETTGPALSFELGRFYAPVGHYCRVRLDLSPADADAEGHAYDGGVGETLSITFHDGRPDLRTGASVGAMLDLERPMEVAGEPREHELSIVLSLDAWPVERFQTAEQALSAIGRALRAPPAP